MSRKHFSGITTVEDLKGRCIVDDFTGCWHWQGATTLDRYGRKIQRVWVYDSLQQKFRAMSGPLAVLELEGSRTAETEMGWRTDCQCEDCLNPAHIIGGTKKQWGNWLRNTGIRCGRASITAANRKNVRSRAILNEEKAAQIRERRLAGESAESLATEFGIKNPKYISEIALGKRWAPNAVIRGASVFTLGAR